MRFHNRRTRTTFPAYPGSLPAVAHNVHLALGPHGAHLGQRLFGRFNRVVAMFTEACVGTVLGQNTFERVEPTATFYEAVDIDLCADEIADGAFVVVKWGDH